MVKMLYPMGVRTYRDGQWKGPEVHALVEVPENVVDLFIAAGFRVLSAVNAGVSATVVFVEPAPVSACLEVVAADAEMSATAEAR